jgi:hypothetical protein
VSPPQVTETYKEEREELAKEVILSLKLADLNGLLLFDLGMNFFFLNKKAMAIETDGFLIRRS